MTGLIKNYDEWLNQQIHDHCNVPKYETCQACNGKGKIYVRIPFKSGGGFKGWKECERCGGTGMVKKGEYYDDEE